MPSPVEHHRYVPKPEAPAGEKAEVPSLSSQALDLMKEGASAVWKETKNSVTDIASGHGTLGDFGFLAAEGGMAVALAGGAALASATSLIGAVGYGTAEAVSYYGLGTLIGGGVTSVGGMIAAEVDEYKKSK